MKSLQEKYLTEIAPALKEKLGLKNIMQIPKLQKITINVGLGRSVKEAAFVDVVEQSLTRITGQKPVKTLAKKSISNFKIRQGMVIGMKVTLRGKKMYDFMNKFVHITLPRVRDFRGIVPRVVDAQGNMSIGLKENIAFPEIKAEDINHMHGIQLTFTSTAKNKQQALALFEALGVPFKK